MKVLEQRAKADGLPHAPVRSVSERDTNVIQLR